MRILQVSPLDAYPPAAGGEHRVHGLVSEFPSENGEVIRIAQGGIVANHDPLSGDLRYERRIESGYLELRPRNPVYDLVRLPRLVGIPGLLFLSEDRVFWNRNRIGELLAWADLVFCEGPWQVPAVLRHDPVVPLLYSSHNVEFDRAIQSRSRFLNRWAAKRVRRIESKAVAESQMVLCVSREDAMRFERLYGSDTPKLVAANATYSKKLEFATGTSTGRDQEGFDNDTIMGVFVGSDYAPNKDAAVQLVNLAPTIRESVPTFELWILGACGRAIGDPPPGVNVTGFVEEIDRYLAAADVAFNPVTHGGGTNIKLFDYFAHGLPVLTTPFGARGIDLVHTKEAIITEVDKFPEWVERLVIDRGLAHRLGRRGRELIRERYTWDQVSRTLLGDLRVAFDHGNHTDPDMDAVDPDRVVR